MAESRLMDYSDLIYRHLDRMSDSLKRGLEVGEIKNATFIMAYYLFVLHFQSLLDMRVTKKAHDKIEEYKQAMPGFDRAWSGSLEDNIEFLEGLSKWFQVLLIQANNSDFLSIAPKTYNAFDEEMKEFEDNGNK